METISHNLVDTGFNLVDMELTFGLWILFYFRLSFQNFCWSGGWFYVH